jgi:hypothetical protein
MILWIRPSSARLKPPLLCNLIRVEPELGDLVLTLDVDVLRFIAIAGVEEQSVRAYPEYCRHLFFVSNCSLA